VAPTLDLMLPDAGGKEVRALTVASTEYAHVVDVVTQDATAPRVHTIIFYRNGVFTVDDGPPRRVDDPANAAFFDAIAKGGCAAELDPGQGAAPVTVNLLRKEEEYKEPEKPK